MPHLSRSLYLTTVELHRLDYAIAPLRRISTRIYLVGSALTTPDYRDVDVRMILTDDKFDALFGHSPALWETLCYAVSRWLSADTDMPIDFQVQRMTEANELEGGGRNHLSGGQRRFAAFGDATGFDFHAILRAERDAAEAGDS